MSNQTCFLSKQDLIDLPGLLSKVSREMYNLPERDPGSVLSWSLVPDFKRIRDNDDASRASIYSSSNPNYKGHYIISFKGTNSSGAAVTDLNALLVKFKTTFNKCSADAKIHSGFNNMYIKLRRELYRFLRDDNRQIKKLYITGHSLGGALAHIFLYDLLVSLGNNMPETVCIPLAAPRIGNYYASRDFTSRLRSFKPKINFVNLVGGIDLIPKLPPTDLRITGRRELTYYDSGQKLKVGNGGHSVERYIKDIQAKRYV